MNEREFESILERYPELVEPGLTLPRRQVSVRGKRIDLLYLDRHGQQLVVELKIGTIHRLHVGQLLDYEGELLSPHDPTIRVMIVGNRVPQSLRRAMDHHGLEWKEVSEKDLIDFLVQQNDEEFLQYLTREEEELVGSSRPRHITTSPSGMNPKVYIQDKFLSVFASHHQGEVLTRKQIIDMVEKAFPGTKRSSIMPSDFCYNIINAGIPFRCHLFEYQRYDWYRVLGRDFDYEGPILWNGRQGNGRQVGEWRKGETEPRMREHVGR